MWSTRKWVVSSLHFQYFYWRAVLSHSFSLSILTHWQDSCDTPAHITAILVINCANRKRSQNKPRRRSMCGQRGHQRFSRTVSPPPTGACSHIQPPAMKTLQGYTANHLQSGQSETMADRWKSWSIYTMFDIRVFEFTRSCPSVFRSHLII